MTRLAEYAYLRRDPCSYCGRAGGTIDHIVPTARGAATTSLNLTGACDRCIGLKGQWPLLPFLLFREWVDYAVPVHAPAMSMPLGGGKES